MVLLLTETVEVRFKRNSFSPYLTVKQTKICEFVAKKQHFAPPPPFFSPEIPALKQGVTMLLTHN
jgi:hypothetical protein